MRRDLNDANIQRLYNIRKRPLFSLPLLRLLALSRSEEFTSTHLAKCIDSHALDNRLCTIGWQWINVADNDRKWSIVVAAYGLHVLAVLLCQLLANNPHVLANRLIRRYMGLKL